MAAVEFDSFYSAFLPQFLGGCEGLTDTQKSELGKNFTPDKVSKGNNFKVRSLSYQTPTTAEQGTRRTLGAR